MEAKNDLRALLWENVSALMSHFYKEERLGQFARDTGIGAASMTRIKKMETAVGIDVVDKIARNCGLEPWQVLAPNMGAHLYAVDAQKRLVSALALPPKIGQVRPPAVADHGLRVPAVTESKWQVQQRVSGKARERKSIKSPTQRRTKRGQP